jgi:hypothetical protein
LGLVHPEKHVIAVEPLRNVEGGNVRDTRAGINRQHDKVPHVLPTPQAIAGAERPRAANLIAGIDSVQFRIGEGLFVRGNGRPFGSAQILRDILCQPLAFETEFYEGFQPLKLLRSRTLFVLP